jgi:malonyl-CoA O-methyltransferase
MSAERPPSIDPQAARRWHQRVPTASAWLHEEVARRMEERLQWIKRAPKSWLHWQPQRGGQQAHALLKKRYPGAQRWLAQGGADPLQPVFLREASAWWQPARWLKWRPAPAPLPSAGVDLLWANMALHMAADPAGLIAVWQRALAVDGFVMFSCLGPDTLRELRELYQRQGWPAPAHEFTDMHDWGDMLVQAGFAEPVMDMERIELSFDSPERLLMELRELGRNLHHQRFTALRGRSWWQRLKALLASELADSSGAGRLRLSFEVVYGHAFKPAPRIPVTSQTVVPLEQMRDQLRARDGQKPRLQ